MTDVAMEAEPARKPNEVLETIKTVVYALLIALVLRTLIFQPYTIPSASMEPSLYEGDYIVVSKWSYGYSRHSVPFSPPLPAGRLFGRAPDRGDVAVFKTPADNRTDLIKRVIGLPGDRIQMREGLLYINGVQVPRTRLADDPATGAQRWRETLPGGVSFVTLDLGPTDLDDTPVFIVPEGHYFMMGDNRDNSGDSRVPAEARGVGFLPAENLVGHARIILWAWKPGSSLFKPWTWLNLNTDRFFHELR